MRKFNIFVYVTLIHCNVTVNAIEESVRETERLVTSYGFRCEAHQLKTDDGYILTTFRIRPRNETVPLKPVLLAHGMFAKSEIFLLMGPKYSIGYILAENGYDVWIMNARGSTHSRKHKYLNPSKDLDFWRFTWNEIGYYDLPANINYILNITQNKNLFYIGYSQGGTIYYVLTSLRPEYNEKIRAAVTLAPSIYKEFPKRTLIGHLAKHVNFLERVIEELQWFELIPNMRLLSKIAEWFCIFLKEICILLLNIIGEKPGLINKNKQNVMFNGVGGGSIFQLIHYLQNAFIGEFKQYDFGYEKNKQIYKQSEPPIYDVKKSTAPNLGFYLFDDMLATRKSMESVFVEMPNAKGHLIKEKNFNHFDFAFAEKAFELVYKPLMEYFENY